MALTLTLAAGTKLCNGATLEVPRGCKSPGSGFTISRELENRESRTDPISPVESVKFLSDQGVLEED